MKRLICKLRGHKKYTYIYDTDRRKIDYNMEKYNMSDIIPLEGNEDLVGTNKESEYIYKVSYEKKQ